MLTSERDGSGNQAGSPGSKDAPEVGPRFPASRVQLRTRGEQGSQARVAEREGRESRGAARRGDQGEHEAEDW